MFKLQKRKIKIPVKIFRITVLKILNLAIRNSAAAIEKIIIRIKSIFPIKFKFCF